MSTRVREWLGSLMGATSIALLVLLPVQVMSWLITVDPTEHTTQWVTDHWAHSLWRALDWVVLVVALVHGCLGTLRWLSRGRVAVWRTVSVGLVAAVSLAVLVLASYTLFTFEIT